MTISYNTIFTIDGKQLNRGLKIRNISTNAKTGLMLASIFCGFASLLILFVNPIVNPTVDNSVNVFELFGILLGLDSLFVAMMSLLLPPILSFILFFFGINSYVKASNAYLNSIDQETSPKIEEKEFNN